MSQENVEIVRKLYELQGDPESLLELFDPHVMWINFASETRPYIGHEGIGEWARGFFAEFRDFRFEPIEVIDAGGDQVVAVQRVLGSGRRSGVPIDREVSCLFTLLNGKIVRGQGFETRAQALEAAGLSE
jgi:ketosteroid isomerase-like protein